MANPAANCELITMNSVIGFQVKNSKRNSGQIDRFEKFPFNYNPSFLVFIVLPFAYYFCFQLDLFSRWIARLWLTLFCQRKLAPQSALWGKLPLLNFTPGLGSALQLSSSKCCLPAERIWKTLTGKHFLANYNILWVI